MEELYQKKILKKFKRGQTIFQEGQPSQGFYCINNGKVKITKKLGLARDTIISLAQVGDIIGHESLFSTGQYANTAIAVEDCAICYIDRKSMISFVKSYPEVAMIFLNKLTKGLCEYEDLITSLVQRNVRERLAELLLNLSMTFGIAENNKIRLSVRLSREELASMIGSVVETVSRFIGEFKDEGLIEEEGKKIYILDSEKLKLFAGHKV